MVSLSVRIHIPFGRVQLRLTAIALRFSCLTVKPIAKMIVMGRISFAVCCWLILPITAFQVSRNLLTKSVRDRQDAVLWSTRKDFVATMTGASLVLATIGAFPLEPAVASGGATAGGVYLLSAKQRYNDRVSKGVAGFLTLGAALENGDIDSVRAFFASEEVGSWKDFSAAGYLLANAFRRNSSAAPDTLPSVKKWKAYTAEVENMTKALKKKDTKKALDSYAVASLALDEYLEKVELPPGKDLLVAS